MTSLKPRDRWRLVLGREKSELSGSALRAARALDEVYGSGRGEGSRSDLPGVGAGSDAPYPSVRDWSEELGDLFGENVREEVLGRAAERGNVHALMTLDPQSVTPSIALLTQVLSMKGAVPEGRLSHLRKLVDRIVAELVRELARRVQPALTGLATPRPTLRPGGPLDLSRTVSRNLRTARLGTGGRIGIVPDNPVFKTRARRSLDWRIVLVVDVSGSMEPSVIYAALMASILASLPAVSVRFAAFSTEVIDLSGLVSDPLGLLLEVAVGGGTDIAKGLRYARTLLTVPRRSLVVLVTDFEEGGPVGSLLSEVRAIVESGATPLGLAALDDAGKPRYNRAVAELVAGAGMPVAALTPLELARWVGEKMRG